MEPWCSWQLWQCRLGWGQTSYRPAHDRQGGGRLPPRVWMDWVCWACGGDDVIPGGLNSLTYVAGRIRGDPVTLIHPQVSRDNI